MIYLELLEYLIRNLCFWVNTTVCAACCLRLLLFTRQRAQHYPWAGVLAYLLIIAFGTLVLLPGRTPSIGAALSQLLLNGVLAAALFNAKGNVMALFRTQEREHPTVWRRLLSRRTWL